MENRLLNEAYYSITLLISYVTPHHKIGAKPCKAKRQPIPSAFGWP